MNQHRRDRIIAAAESGDGFTNLREVVQTMLDDGVHADTLLDDLGQVRGLVTEAQEEIVLDVMDLVVGWCAPSARLKPRGGGAE